MSKSLYEEAIADAKRLREVAEQNAKNAIIEAVTPRIREFIDKQIVNETTDEQINAEDFVADAVGIKAETTVQVDEEVVLDETALKSLARLFTPKADNVVKSAKDDFQQAFDQLSETEKKNLLNLINEKDETTHTVSEIQEKTMTDETLYEIDLDELKQEIAAAAATSPVSAAKKSAPPAPGMKPAVKKPVAPAFGTKKPVAAMDEASEDEALNEDTLEIDLGDVELPEDFMPTVRVVRPDEEEGTEADFESDEMAPEMDDEMPAEDEAAAAEDESALEDEGAPMEEVYEIDEDTLRLELARLREARAKKEKLLVSKKNLKSQPHVKAAAKAFGDGELEEVDEVEINALDTAKKHKLKKLEEARANRALQTQLNEYRSAVNTLREQMTDLNLFNAKLLYVNKMLQTKDLTPKQQKVVIEAIDGAKTLREVKMLYKSLTETLVGGNTSSLNESATRFAAGGSSRATGSATARTNEGGEVDRWARLAGLK